MARAQLILPRADSGCGKVSTTTVVRHMGTSSLWNSGTERLATSARAISWRSTGASGAAVFTSARSASKVSPFQKPLRPSTLRAHACFGYPKRAWDTKVPRRQSKCRKSPFSEILETGRHRAPGGVNRGHSTEPLA